MSTELFDQLEKKVSNALETIEMLRMENEELRAKNEKLVNERQQGESRLNNLLSRFSELDEQTSNEAQTSAQPEAQSHQASEHSHY